jgi:hypothetical protein
MANVPNPNSPEVEATTYAQLMHSIDTAPAEFERNSRILRFLSFLNTSKHLLNEAGVRANIKQRIQSIAQEPRFKDFDMFLNRLCTKLEEKGESINFPGCKSPTVPPDFKYIAKGSFGCVYKPALPNISENGQSWESYPGDVVKFFKRKEDLNRAVESARAVYEELGHNEGHRLTPYKYKSYRKMNIGPKIDACNLDDKILHAARMPNLGVDFLTIYHLPLANIAPLKQIHVSKIGAQVKKLFQQLVALQTNNKIHGDIRETNLMIKGDGIMTIVDFDWLFPKHEFYLRYYKAFGFYNNPPESLLFDFMKELFAGKDDIATVRQIITPDSDKKKAYIAHHNKLSFHELFLFRKFAINDINEANEANFTYLKNLYGGQPDLNHFRYACFSEMSNTFDSYGLAFCLLELFNKLYLPVFGSDVPNEEDKEWLKTELSDNGLQYTDAGISKAYNFLHNLINRILRPMIDWNLERRKTAATALAELDVLLATLHAPGGGGARSRRQRAKRSKGTRRRHHRK